MIDRLARENLERAAYNSPFNFVADIQRWVSSVAATTVRPPSTLVSADGMNITHDGQTLNVPAHRLGLQNALADLTAELKQLLFGFNVDIEMPEAPIDSWSNTERGYSFVSNHEYIPPDSFFRHLLRSSEADLTWTDTHGKLHFKVPSINRLVVREAKFLKKFGPFIAIACSVSRIAEFLDAKIKNSTRPRTLFMHLRDLYLVTRRMKYENLIGHAVFTPHLVPAHIRDLLLRHLLIFRPALVKLLRIAQQEEAAFLYDEYVWVFNRQRISTDAFSELLREFTEKYSGVGLKTLALRHIVVRGFLLWGLPHLLIC